MREKEQHRQHAYVSVRGCTSKGANNMVTFKDSTGPVMNIVLQASQIKKGIICLVIVASFHCAKFVISVGPLFWSDRG